LFHFGHDPVSGGAVRTNDFVVFFPTHTGTFRMPFRGVLADCGAVGAAAAKEVRRTAAQSVIIRTAAQPVIIT